MNFPVVFKEFANFRRYAPKIAKKNAKKIRRFAAKIALKKMLKRNFAKIAKNHFFIFSRRKMLKKLLKKLIFGENC